MVAGGVEDVVQGPQAGHQLSVDPELVEGAQLLVDHGVAHRDKQGQGEVERLHKSGWDIYFIFYFLRAFKVA